MKTRSLAPKGMERRNFLKIVGVAGVGAACWQLGLFSGAKPLQAARRSQPIMGTVLNLTLYGPDLDACEEAIDQTVATMQALEGKLSRHLPGSEVFRLNQQGFLDTPSEHVLEIVRMSRQLYQASEGAFDPTILPLLQRYEVQTAKGGADTMMDPTTGPVAIGFAAVEDSPEQIRLARKGGAVSFDGIAKGYIVDQGVATLKAHGFDKVCVDAGGDLMVTGDKAKGQPWRIALRPPREKLDSRLVTIAVSNRAVATSGDYLQAFSADLRQHHIIDPRSGFSPPDLASCTVTAPEVALADGLATAVMVLGPDRGRELVESLAGCEAYMVTKDLKVSNTTGFFS